MQTRKSHRMPIRMVREMAKFFLKTLFDGIPEIPIHYGTLEEDTGGMFIDNFSARKLLISIRRGEPSSFLFFFV